MKELTQNQALNKSAALCSTKELCESEIRKRLQTWKIPEEVHTTIINTLIEKGFINHTRYAHSFVHDKSLYSKWGSKKIEYALRGKQIETDIIAKALQEIAPDQQQEILRRILITKLNQLKEPNLYQRNQKLIRLALSKGFAYEMIRKEITRIDPDFNDIDSY